MSSSNAVAAALKLTGTAAVIGGVAGQKVGGSPGAMVGAASGAVVGALVCCALLATEVVVSVANTQGGHGNR